MTGLHEFLPHNDFMALSGAAACYEKSIFKDVCSNLLFLIGGYNSKELNESVVPVYTSNTPAGASTKQLIHYGQEINSANFQKFDYGLLNNLNRYGSAEPPSYNLNQITAPIALFYSENDLLAHVEVRDFPFPFYFVR